MKKAVKYILLIALGIVILVGGAAGGVFLAYRHLLHERYGYLKVNFTSDVGFSIKDLAYGEDPLQKYDLYLPADGSKAEYPLILYVHGGGFTGGDKGSIDAERYGEYLASKGYVVASANYRLAAEGSSVCILDMYEDLLSAVNACVQKTDELGYHVTEMATTGGSAGGCLAMMLALKEPDRLSIPIRLVFEETGPASFEPELWGINTADEKANFVNVLSGKSFTGEDVGSAAYQQAINEISVSTMVNEQTVPMLLAYGPLDKIVSVQAKYPLLDALQIHGVEHTYIEFPHSGHGLSGDPDKTQEWFGVMEKYLSSYIPVK